MSFEIGSYCPLHKLQHHKTILNEKNCRMQKMLRLFTFNVAQHLVAQLARQLAFLSLCDFK